MLRSAIQPLGTDLGTIARQALGGVRERAVAIGDLKSGQGTVKTELRENAVGLPGMLMQRIATIAPSCAILAAWRTPTSDSTRRVLRWHMPVGHRQDLGSAASSGMVIRLSDRWRLKMRSSNRPQDVEASGTWIAETKLKAGSLRLTGVLMQNITHIAPAIAAFFFTPFVVSLAGGRSILAYAIGVVVVFGLGVCLTQLAKNFPSAGGYFTYISRTIGPRTRISQRLDFHLLCSDRVGARSCLFRADPARSAQGGLWL